MPDTALSSPPPAPPAADLQACESLMRGGSRSFFAASRVLPSRIRSAAVALYAFCRVADDAIDLAPDPALALVALRRRLDRIYAGLPLPIDADTALAGIVGPYALPRAWRARWAHSWRW
jgi:phytoene synthase